MDPASGGLSLSTTTSSKRLLTSKQKAPLPPPKALKCDPEEVEILKDDIHHSFSASQGKTLLKQSHNQAKEPQAVLFKKIDGQEQEQSKTVEEQKVLLSHAGDKLLATFYGMLYTKDSTERDWKLEVDGFIPICFVQVQGNANKPFRIIAVEKSSRIMDYQVNTNTTCARSSTFVKWQDGLSMFGVRFGREDQAEQFLTTVKRMASTVSKTALLLKQPERKAIIEKMSDPASSNIHHTKVSLMIKLPDKQTTVLSVPGLLTMSELFEEICEKEHLNPAEHQLSLPRTGGRKVTFDSGTAVGSLKIREVAIIRTGASDSSAGNVEVEDESVEELLDTKGEESKILQFILPSGIKKSYCVSVDTTVKQLVTSVCSRENLNPRHHSLQYIDFKHEFIDAGSTVNEIEVKQVRLMDKRDLRKSCGDEMEADNSTLSERDRENKILSPPRSKSLEVLSDDKHENTQEHSPSNGCVPPSMKRVTNQHSSTNKPPVRPQPFRSSKSVTPLKNQTGNVSNDALKELPLSPLKRSDIMYASSPELSVCSSKSDDSPEFDGNIKTSTPDTKRRRRAPPPPRPAAPKALFSENKTNIHGNGAAVKTTPSSMASSTTFQVSAANDDKLKPSHKKRPAPPRPDRPPPPQPAPRLTKKGSQGGKDVSEDKREKDASVHLEQNKGITQRPDRVQLSLNLETHRSDNQEEDEVDNWRGVPVFIPPPPPDELPPPLDECETPVGPLTDLEADILEGAAVTDGFPVTMNGFIGMHEIGMFAANGVNDARAQAIQAGPDEEQESKDHSTTKAKPEVSLEPVPEQEAFPVVPPPPLYSEPESSLDAKQLNADKTPRVPPAVVSNSGFVDVPPPVIEAQTVRTISENDVKNHNSGFDQGTESITITPPLDQANDFPLGHREDPDSGSSLDMVSTIPPPADFETWPLTPPCQFANPTVAPPEEFVNSEEIKKEEGQPKEEKFQKKLYINEGLFPWMDETQAPFNATIPSEVSKDTENGWVVVDVNTKESTPVDENHSEYSVDKEAVETKTVTSVSDVLHTSIAQERVDNHGGVSTAPEIIEKTEKTPVTEKQSLGPQRSVFCDKNKDMLTSQAIYMKESGQVETNEVIVTNLSSKQGEHSGSKQFSNTIIKPVKPEGGSVSISKETEIQVEAGVNAQQYSLPPRTQDVKQELSAEPAKPALQVKPTKPELQVKAEKPAVTEKPVTIIQEAEVKVAPAAVNLHTELARPDPQVERGNFDHAKPEKPEIKAKPVQPIKEAEGAVDFRRNTRAEAAKQELDVSLKQLKENALNSEKPEAPAKPSHLVKDKDFNPDAVVVKVESPVIPEKRQSSMKPTAFVTEAEVKVDTRQVEPLSISSSVEVLRPNINVPPVEQDQQVKPELLEQVETFPIEEVITQQSKPEVQMCFTSFKEDQDDHPTDPPQSMRNGVASVVRQVVTAQETPVKTVSTERKEMVEEVLVTPETKLVSSPDDKLKDLEAKLQTLDEETVPSSPNFNKLENKALPTPYKDATPAVQTKDPFSEDIIVSEMKKVESSDYEYYEALFKMETTEKSTGEVKTVQPVQKVNVVPERQPSVQGSSTTHVNPNSELSLDLTSFRQSPELPRPPSSSPPATSPRGSTLPSPVALSSDRSTDSGFSPSEEPKGPASPDTKMFGVNSLSTSGTVAVQAQTVIASDTSSEERHPKSAQAFSATQTDVQVDTGSVQIAKPHITKRPVGVSSKLQRPLSMPAGIVTGDLKSQVVQVKSKTTEPQSRKSSSSYSSDGFSPSPGTSPVDSSKTEPADLPKPPPFTVPSLRRYSDLAADLSFISSAAKAAEKSNVSEVKAEVSAKPPNLLLRRNPDTAVERPRSWMGPGTDTTKKKPMMWGSAFKPVSFDAQGKKGIRPIEFQVKSFSPSPLAPKQSTSPSTSYVDSATLVHSTISVTEKVRSNTELEETSKPAPPVPSKPAVAKPSAVRVSSLPQGELSSHQRGKPDPKLERSVSTPETKKTEPGATKYEIVYSSKHSTSQSSSKDLKDTTDGGSRSDLPSPAKLRDQTSGPSGVTRGRPRSTILTGSNFNIISADEKLPRGTVGSDTNKPATIQPKGLFWTQAKHQTNEQNKHLLQAPTTVKPPPSAKTAAGADTKPLPAVAMRTKAGNYDPTKRHSLPSYVIEGADGKQSSIKKSGKGEAKFHFIVKEADTDTTVVPRGVVAAMKALREQKETSQGELNLEPTQLV